MLRSHNGLFLGAALLILGSCANVPEIPTDGAPDSLTLDHIGISAECAQLPRSEMARELLGVGKSTSISGITGFHDCQPLPTSIDTMEVANSSYGPVAKLWAVQDLATYDEQAFETAPEPGLPVAVITMEDPGGGYRTLGIVEEEQCVYLRGIGKEWTATVAPCAAPGEIPDTQGAPLKVVADQQAGIAPSDYPPVARWGWDHEGNLPYMGVRCGAAWCDIGPADFEPSRDLCEGRAKGYCDEQILAVERNGTLVPSHEMRAILRPVPGVDQWSVGEFREWVEAATVEIPGAGDSAYVRKFGYRPGINRVYLRRLNREGTEIWGAMIQNDRAREPVYREVVLDRHDDDVQPPGAARWAWTDSDESSWLPCPTGCCYITDRELLF